MNIKTQIFVIGVVFLGMIMLVNMIRKKRLELKYSLLWFVLGIGIFVLGCFPSITSWLAHVFGIGQPINLLFFAGFCFSLMIIFSLTAAISKMSIQVKRLIQELGLLKKELEEMKKEDEERGINK